MSEDNPTPSPAPGAGAPADVCGDDHDKDCERFIERMGLAAERGQKLPRIAGRILGLLLLESEPLGFEEIADCLQVSRGSVSSNTRLLEQHGLIERTTRPGDRRDYFRITDAPGACMLERATEHMQEMEDILTQARDCIGRRDAAVDERLERMQRFYSTVRAAFKRTTEELRQAMRALALGLVAALALGAGACGGDSDAAGDAPPPPTVGVVQPEERSFAPWDEFTGRLSAVETVEVRPRVSGYVQRIHFREGALVDEGDLLFTLDPRPFRADLAEEQAGVESAEVALRLAESELARVEPLAESRAVSQEELDQRRRAVETARAQVAAAEAAAANAALDVEFTRVTAPVAGRVGRARVTEGNLVTGGSGSATVLTTLVSIDPVYLYFTADERSALRYLRRLGVTGGGVEPGEGALPVEMGLADEEGYPHRGHVDFVDNAVDEGTGTLALRARFANPDGTLRPGMFGRVRLRAGEPRPVLTLPEEAIQVDQTQEYVLVVGADDTVERRVVTTGGVADGRRVVAGGLDRGDRVVVEGIQAARPGATVAPRPAEVAGEQAAGAANAADGGPGGSAATEAAPGGTSAGEGAATGDAAADEEAA